MKRVTVIGAPGTDKSMFSLRLGKVTGLPVVHLGQHFWNPGWVGTPRDECRRIHAGLLAPDQWIVDGGYSNTPDDRVALADTVIFLDLPRPVYLWRIEKKNAHDLRPRQAGLGARMPGTI
jgi:adenylate kinase family enzyme